MKEILIITGACGVGKTTLAKEWAKSKNGAIIECDYLTEWIFNKKFPHWTLEEEKFTANLTATIAVEYLDYGMSVAIENVWSPHGLEILKRKFIDQTDIAIKMIWLYCELNENHKRDEQRVPENQMKERVDIVNKELQGYDWPEELVKIDSTKLSVAQTLALLGN